MSMFMPMVLAEPMPVRPAKFAAAAVVEMVTAVVMRGGKVLMSRGAVNRKLRAACRADADAINREVGYRSWLAINIGNRGLVLRRMGKLEEAWAALGEAEAINRELGDKRTLASNVFNKAQVLLAKMRKVDAYVHPPTHHLEAALRLVTESRELRRGMGATKTDVYFETVATLAVIQHRLGDAATAAQTAAEARVLAAELKLTRDHAVLDIREAFAYLDEVAAAKQGKWTRAFLAPRRFVADPYAFPNDNGQPFGCPSVMLG